MNKTEMYNLMCRQMEALAEDCESLLSNLSNASALVYDTLEGLNWAGFYLLKDEALLLGPFQGKPACVKIQIGKGVCGSAVSENKIMRIENVHDFKGHIACDCASNSEIVLPIRHNGKIMGVLDIDSPSLARFDAEDEKGLAEFVSIMENVLDWEQKLI